MARSRPRSAGSPPSALLAWALLALAAHQQQRVGAAKLAKGTAANGTDLLHLHLNDSGEFDWSRPANGKCPTWVANYTAFHKSMRGTPEAKYLVHTCHTRRDCFYGLGDRMRGLYPAIQLAIANKRVLLIDWASPSPLEHFMVPALIDWTIAPDLGVDVRQGSVVSCCNRAKFRNNVGDKDNRVWTLSTNSMPFSTRHDARMPKEVPQFSRVGWHTHCFMTALFQPSPALLQVVDAEQLRLLGSLDKPFVAVHLRMGHLPGEGQDLARGWDHTEGLLAAYQCAWRRNHLLHARANATNATNATSTLPPALAASPPNSTNSTDPASPAGPRRRRLPSLLRSAALLATSTGGRRLRASQPRRQKAPGQAGRHGERRSSRRALRASEGGEDGLQALHHHAHHGHHLHRHHHNGSHLHPMLLLTDHAMLRASVAHGMLAGVVGPNYAAYHIAQYREQSGVPPDEQERVSLTTFVDLVLLARAHCLVWAPSGFPMLAMTLGFNPCTIDINNCIRESRSIKSGGPGALTGLLSAG